MLVSKLFLSRKFLSLRIKSNPFLMKLEESRIMLKSVIRWKLEKASVGVEIPLVRNSKEFQVWFKPLRLELESIPNEV